MHHESKTKRQVENVKWQSKERGLKLMQKMPKQKKRKVRWTYFEITTSENEEKSLEEPHHSENGDNVERRQPNW